MQSKILNIIDINNLIKITKKNKININILFFSMLLLPISLFAGPAITEILIFLIVISYIYSFIIENEKIVFNNLKIIIISFFFIIVLSSILSEFKFISLKSSFLSIRFIILIYSIIFILKKIDYFKKYFFIICLASIILNIFASLIQFIFSEELLSMLKADVAFKLTGFFGDEKKLGSFLSRLSPLIIGLYLFLSNKNINKKINNVLIFFTILFCFVFLTAERMAIVYCAITFFFIMFYGAKINKKIFVIFPLFVILLPLLFYQFNIIKFRITIDNTYEQIFPKGNLVFFSKQHQAFAISSIELFKEKPILGIGPNNFRRSCNPSHLNIVDENLINYYKNIPNCSTHPHNIFFQLLSEIGLLGIIYYIIFNLLLFLEVFKFFFKKNYNQSAFFFLLPVIYYLNPFFPSGNFFNNWYMCIGILGLPFFIYLTKIKKSV